ncbi:reticulocyte-binding protein PFD0110w-like isoform X2 [Monomorium pharaonis]|nr:reticulocyte-binding protein PFD0110w-like isoform X2 [Monomorium pharaonis]
MQAGNAAERLRTTEDFRETKIDKPEIKEFSPIRTKLVDMLQKSTIINTVSEYNVNSSNVIIPELKTYSQEKANNFTVENQNAHLDLELVEHIDTSLYHETIRKDVSRTKSNLGSKNQSIDNLHIEKNSKVIIKRRLSSESLLQNVLPAKIQKKNEINTSPDKVADSIIESSDSITIDLKQRIWKDVTKCLIKKKTFSDVTHSKVQPTANINCQCAICAKFAPLHALTTSNCVTYSQATISSQLTSSKSRSQAAPRLSISSQLGSQSASQLSVSVQSSQLAHPLVFSQLTSAQSTTPSVPPQLVFSQSTPRPSTFSQSTLIQSAPRPSISLQSAPRLSIFSQLAQQARHPSVSLHTQTHPQLASQSVSQQLLSYNTADNQINSSQANVPITPVEIKASNINKHNNTIIQNTIKNICTYVGFCRDFIRCRLLRTHISMVIIQKMSTYVMQIKQDLQKLQALLRMNIQDVITYVNQYMLFDPMLTYTELYNYVYLIGSCRAYATQILQQSARSNASDNSNITLSTNMSNIGTQQVPMSISNISSSNTNMHSYGPVNQENINMPPLQTRNKTFISTNITQTNQVIYNFNLSNFTNIQKIILHNQIQSYFLIAKQITRFLNIQECERIHYEKITLFILYQRLQNYIQNLIKESQTTEKYHKKNSQNKSQSKSVLEENVIKILIDNSTQTQSNRDNNNSVIHNSNLEKQSLKQNIDSDISKNLKLTASKNNLKAQTEESLLTTDFSIIEKPLPKNIQLQEPSNNVLKEKLKQKLQKSLLIEKQPKTIETLSPSHLKTSEKNVLIEAEYSNTEAQDNARINESQKAVSSYNKQYPNLLSLLTQNLLNLQNALTEKTKDQAEIATNNANERSNNMETENEHKTSNVADSNAENNAPLRFSCKDQNDEAYNNSNKISNKNLQNKMRNNVKESIGILNSTEIQSDPLTLSHSPEPSSLNSILESASSRKKYKYTEITQATHENRAKTISKLFLTQQEDPTNEWSDNSSDGTSESSWKLYIDESPEKSQKEEQYDEVSFSEEDNLNASQASASRLLNAKYKSTEITQIHIAHEEHIETMSELCLNAQQEDPTNKSSAGMSKNSWKYIDKNPEKSQKHECDKVSSSKEDNNLNTSQVSPSRLFNVITKHESTKETQVHVTHEEHAETTSEFCLNAQQEDFSNDRDNDSTDKMSESPEKVYVDESIKNTEVILSFPKNISEANLADVSQEFDAQDAEEENNTQSLLNMEEIYLSEMLLKFEVPEEALSMEESTMQSMYLPENSDNIRELFEDMEEEKLIIDIHNNINAINEHGKKEEMITDTHSDINMTKEHMDEIKMITDTHNDINITNEHFQHVSEQKYDRKFQRPACNSVQEDNPVDVNKNKEIFAENNVLNTDIVECISTENKDNSEVMEIMPSILNVRSISPSLFEKLDNMNSFSQNDLKMLNKNDRKLININNDLEISDMDDKPCLRCKRKSTVCCQACLEAHYCSKRCSSLHWNAEHYKKCKG